MSSLRRKANSVPAVGPDNGAGLGSSPGGVPNRDYGPSRGLLDLPEPYEGQLQLVPIETLYPGRGVEGFEEGVTAQGKLGRSVGMWLTPQTYPLRELNRQYLIELGTVYGREGDDFQNPYVWASRGVLAWPSENSTELAAGTYGDRKGTTPADVALNVRATSHVLAV